MIQTNDIIQLGTCFVYQTNSDSDRPQAAPCWFRPAMEAHPEWLLQKMFMMLEVSRSDFEMGGPLGGLCDETYND